MGVFIIIIIIIVLFIGNGIYVSLIFIEFFELLIFFIVFVIIICN